MEGFVRRENIRRYLGLLQTTTDEAERATIMKLLAEEEHKPPDVKNSESSEHLAKSNTA